MPVNGSVASVQDILESHVRECHTKEVGVYSLCLVTPSTSLQFPLPFELLPLQDQM